MISGERKEYVSIFEERIIQQYGSYIQEVQIVPLGKWESCRQQFDIAFTSYPLSCFADTEHVIYNPLVLSESSLSCVCTHLMERNRFQQKLERLFLKGCFAHTESSIVKEMMEHSEEVIPYRYGTGCMIMHEEKRGCPVLLCM